MAEPVERVVDYLYDQYSQPISLADMAGVAYLSQFHFARTFREATGVSPGRFLSAVRLRQARNLLQTTSLTVTDISYMVGYNSLGTFARRSPPTRRSSSRYQDSKAAHAENVHGDT